MIGCFRSHYGQIRVLIVRKVQYVLNVQEIQRAKDVTSVAMDTLGSQAIVKLTTVIRECCISFLSL